MIDAAIAISFAGQYIADPYWPAMYKLIEIQKKSGMNRAKASQNARKALEEYLRAQGMTLADYEALEREAREPFHRDGQGRIVIPGSNVLSFLVAVCDEIRAAQRPCNAGQVRSRFASTDWTTSRCEPDGVWERFATVNAGPGGKLSNQRGLRSNAYISGFTATGVLTYDPQFVDTPTLRAAIAWGGLFVGIGASRKMGKGRFALARFDAAPAAAPAVLAEAAQ